MVGPQVLIEQTERRLEPGSDRWVVTWRLTNLADRPLQILAARVPHSRFRSEARELTLGPLSPNGSAPLKLPVACREAPGAVVQNAFIILSVLHGEGCGGCWPVCGWRSILRADRRARSR